MEAKCSKFEKGLDDKDEGEHVVTVLQDLLQILNRDKNMNAVLEFTLTTQQRIWVFIANNCKQALAPLQACAGKQVKKMWLA